MLPVALVEGPVVLCSDNDRKALPIIDGSGESPSLSEQPVNRAAARTVNNKLFTFILVSILI